MKKRMKNDKIYSLSSQLEEKIRKQREGQELKPFFAEMDKIFILEKVRTHYLTIDLKKGQLTESQVHEKKAKTQKIIERLLVDYIKDYEKRSFKQAMTHETEAERWRSDQASYDAIQAYNSYLATEIQEYVDDSWRDW